MSDCANTEPTLIYTKLAILSRENFTILTGFLISSYPKTVWINTENSLICQNLWSNQRNAYISVQPVPLRRIISCLELLQFAILRPVTESNNALFCACKTPSYSLTGRQDIKNQQKKESSYFGSARSQGKLLFAELSENVEFIEA